MEAIPLREPNRPWTDAARWQLAVLESGALTNGADDPKYKGSGLVRMQGRPSRGSREVGRANMIEKMREAMKAKPKFDIQRREIAEYIGVTPALVGYYFPDKGSLIEEAATPVIDKYIAEIRSIIKSEGDPAENLHALVYLFIKFNADNGFLLDFYIDHVTTRVNHNSLAKLQEIYGEMNGFFATLLTQGVVEGDDAKLVQSALWGACKYLAQQPSIISVENSNANDEMLRSMTSYIFETFISGAARRVS